MKLKNPVGRRPSDFKNPVSAQKWAKRVYEANKGVIDESMPKPKFAVYNSEQLFYRAVNAIMKEQDKDVLEAIDHLVRSEVFTPPHERIVNNAISGLKNNFGNQYKWLASTTRGKFNPELYKWNADIKAYVYNGKWVVDYSNSPMEIIIRPYNE